VYPYPPPGTAYAAPPPGYGPAPVYPYAVPPGYQPPPGYDYLAQPTGLPPLGDTPSSFADASPVIRKYRRRRSGAGKFIWAGFALILTVGLVVGGVYGWPRYKHLVLGPGIEAANSMTDPIIEPDNAAATKGKPTGLAAASTAFPRRMLFLHVSNHLYANPLSAGQGKRSTDYVSEVARRLAFDWRIPQDKDNNQLFLLSDTAPQTARPMLRPVIQQAYEQFCDTSRAQDRILIYFGGHAVEKEGKAYLVPADGDLADPATLIPLDDFFARVAACKAQQKVVIFDVCRLNEDDDQVRPGSEPMTEALETALHKAPQGVQVVTACIKGQNALEYRRTPPDESLNDVAGSLLLSAMRYVADRGAAKAAKPPAPEDPLPIAAWVTAAAVRMKEVAGLTGKPVPTPRLSGTEGIAIAYNPSDPPASRFDFVTPAKGLSHAELAKVTDRITLPLLRGERIGPDGKPTTEEEPVDNLVPFSEAVMKDYLPDAVPEEEMMKNEKYRLRRAAIQSLETIRKEWRAATDGGKGGLRDTFTGETNDSVKKQIAEEQETPATIILELEERVQEMETMLGELKTEPTRYWQATFLYALAQAKARLAFMHEYDYALGNIRTDSIPKADARTSASGLQLVSVDKMKSKKDIKEIADSAKTLFAQVATEHRGTPWAVQAKRWQVIALGLEWRPFREGGMLKVE
jgi:hypothetical protein